ncbi:hypothetical protein ACSBR1_030861 [Camellia fascicularis]
MELTAESHLFSLCCSPALFFFFFHTLAPETAALQMCLQFSSPLNELLFASMYTMNPL